MEKGVLRNFTKSTGKHLACNFVKRETLAQVFSCEFRKISKNTFFTEHLRTTASANSPFLYLLKTSETVWFLEYGCRVFTLKNYDYVISSLC